MSEPDDRASNKLYERALQSDGSRSNLYEPYDSDGAPEGGYDSLNRLRQYQRGILSSTGGRLNQGGGSVSTVITLPGTNEYQTYDLDGLGNWKSTSYEPEGGSDTTQLRQHNKLNQITETNAGTAAGGTGGLSTSELSLDFGRVPGPRLTANGCAGCPGSNYRDIRIRVCHSSRLVARRA